MIAQKVELKGTISADKYFAMSVNGNLFQLPEWQYAKLGEHASKWVDDCVEQFNKGRFK
ncbi:hypothetical protein [Methylotenera sp.]|uniref:hypothetical protein n=1 Tax=Methylotenera sp. TaxID=2051956 RepID=UPI0024893CD7|nr:hypothetical protein [Methylotenera sp.]MDI1362551.1 hypothetical protein [Methylotenera sp.]